MLRVNDLSMQFGPSVLFSRVDLQFTAGNCYGIIGANGAGKSTFIKILSGELEPTSGSVTLDPRRRMSVLKQNQSLYDDYTVLDAVIMGNPRLYACGKEKDAIYDKPDFSDEDGIRAAELEEEFAELGGWEAESDAGRILQGLGVDVSLHQNLMRDTDPRIKVKVLLAQALFGHPDVILLDEPTNNLDLKSVVWLEDFLMDYEGTVLVVSHDRYFLNNVCTHIVDIDYGKIKMYVGNYDFWYESSQLIQKLIRDQNKKAEQKIQELQTFIARGGGAARLRTALPLGGLQGQPRAGQGSPLCHRGLQDRRRREAAGQGELHRREGRQDRCRREKRACRHDAVQDPHGRGGAGLRHGQVGRQHRARLLPQGPRPLFRRLRVRPDRLDAPVLRGQAGELSAHLPRADAVFRGRRVQAGEGPLRRRARALHALAHDALGRELPLNNGLEAFKYNILFSCHDHQLTQTVANRIIEITDAGVIDRRCSYDEYVHLSELESAVHE